MWYPPLLLWHVLSFPCSLSFNHALFVILLQISSHSSAWVLLCLLLPLLTIPRTQWGPVTCFSLLGLIIMYVSVLPAYIYMYYVHVLMFVEVRRGLSISWNWIRGDCNLPYLCWEQTSMCLYPLNHPPAPLFYFCCLYHEKVSVSEPLYLLSPLFYNVLSLRICIVHYQ